MVLYNAISKPSIYHLLTYLHFGGGLNEFFKLCRPYFCLKTFSKLDRISLVILLSPCISSAEKTDLTSLECCDAAVQHAQALNQLL